MEPCLLLLLPLPGADDAGDAPFLLLGEEPD